MNKKEIKEKIEDGYIHFSSIIEVLGKPKAHVEQTIKTYIKRIKENKNIKILKEDYSKAKKVEELFGIFVEIEALAKNIDEMVFFCFDYMPSSIEIIEPEEINYKKGDFSAFLNDLQARLHNVDMALKQYKARNNMLIKNSAILLRNIILVFLEQGPKSRKDIAQRVGLPEDKIENILKIMIKENRIKKEGKNYELR